MVERTDFRRLLPRPHRVLAEAGWVSPETSPATRSVLLCRRFGDRRAGWTRRRFSGASTESAIRPWNRERVGLAAADLDVAPLDDSGDRPIGVVVLTGLGIRVPRVIRDAA